MKKLLVSLVALILIVFQLSAQKTKDILYLKNGSIIYGNLTEISNNQYKITTGDGSLFVYSAPEVDKFLKGTPSLYERKYGGLGFSLEAGFLLGSQRSEFDAPFSFNFIFNYTNNTRNILGLGSGVEFLGSTYTPLFLEYKRILYDRKTTPFIFIRGGTILHLGGDNASNDNFNPSQQYNYPVNYKGGASFGFGTGVSWAGDGNETYLSFGYRYAQTSFMELNYNNQYITFKNYYNRLEIKLGFKF